MLLGSGTAAAAHTTSVPAGAGSSVQVQSPRTPLEIGSEKQLFLDDQVIESMEPRVFRLLNQPIKYRENPAIPLGTDWEQKGGLSHGGDAGTVFYDEDQKLYRFYDWMIEWPPQGGSYKKFLFYGESEDGLHWRKPAQGQVSYLGFDTKEPWRNKRKQSRKRWTFPLRSDSKGWESIGKGAPADGGSRVAGRQEGAASLPESSCREAESNPEEIRRDPSASK